MSILLVMIGLYVLRMSGCDHLSQSELEITSSLIDHFHVSFCVYIVTDSAVQLWPVTSDDSQQVNVFVSMWTMEQLKEYLENMDVAEKRSGKYMVVMKEDESSLESLRELSQNGSISSPTWIVYGDKSLDVADYDGIYIPYNCEFIHVNPRGKIHLLTEMYRIKKTSGMETTNFGFWSQETGLTVHEQLLYRRRKTLKSHMFSAIIENEPPYIVRDGTNTFKGYFFEVWKEIEQRLKFGIKHSQQDAAQKFRIEDIQYVDFAVAPVAYQSSTLDHMDITHPIYESRTYLFGHRPGSELEWDSYLKPFDAQTWWVTLAWMTFSSAALALLYKIAWNFGTSETEAEYFVFTFGECLATVFRAMCMQGSDVTPRSNACRLLFLSIYLTALVVSSAFSAALFSLLTIPTSRAPFTSFEQVINNKAFRIGLIQSSEIHEILQEYTLKYPTSIQNELLGKVERENNRNPQTLLEGLNSVCRSRTYVMISELPYVLHEMQNMTRDCQEKIMPAGPILLRSFIGFGMKKGSPYKEIIDLHLLMMRNEGIIQRLLINNWPPSIPSVQATWVRVTLADISPILYMFALGAVLAIVLLVAEKIHFFLFRRGPERKNLSKGGAPLTESFARFSSKLKLDRDATTKLATVHIRDYWH